jgi:hypothetical protein
VLYGLIYGVQLGVGGPKKELLATSIRIKMRRKDAEHRMGQIFGSITGC